MNLENLSDSEFLKQSLLAANNARLTTGIFLEYLAENLRRRLYVVQGFNSLYAFCVEEYKLSSASASRRVAAAKALCQFPELLIHINSGELCLTNISKAMSLFEKEKHSREECRAVFAEMVGKSTSETETILLRHTKCPKKVRDEKVTRLNEEFTEFRIVANTKLTDKLKTLKGQFNCANYTVLLDKLTEQNVPRKTPSTGNSRRPSNYTKYEVRKRDQNQCTKEKNGKRCPCATNLQFDHIIPWAQGGKTTTDNLRLRCHAHNQQHAEQTYGPFVKRYRRQYAQ